jgi:DNA-binding transcriptional MerR regulator
MPAPARSVERADDTNGKDAPTQSDGGGGGFTAARACEIVGITSRQLGWWTRTGLLHPSIGRRQRAGSQVRYSYPDLIQLKVVKRLLDGGLSMRAARSAVDTLRSSDGDLQEANLVIADGRSVLAYSGEEIMDLLKGGQMIHIIPLGGLMSELPSPG